MIQPIEDTVEQLRDYMRAYYTLEMQEEGLKNDLMKLKSVKDYYGLGICLKSWFTTISSHDLQVDYLEEALLKQRIIGVADVEQIRNAAKRIIDDFKAPRITPLVYLAAIDSVINLRSHLDGDDELLNILDI
jgi:hypothetical protein